MKTLFHTLLLLVPFQLFAQQNLVGSLTDTQGNPIDAATITLSQNKQIIYTQLADHGKFILKNLNQMPYQISASLVGYQPLTTTFVLPADTLKLTLSASQTQLKEVAISFHKPLIEQKLDRVTFNVANSILASGGTVWDAIGKTPGVQTNETGITANHKSVTVYIDDKPVRMSGDELTNYLRSLPSDNLSKIEVFANPTAKYDAQGGTVINIISKKSNLQGLNATLSSGYTRATFGSTNNSALLNYRKNKLNIFGSYGYAYRKTQQQQPGYAIFETPDTYAYWDKLSTNVSQSKASSYKLGADYDLSADQVIGFLINGYHRSNSGLKNTLTNIYNDHKLTTDSLLRSANQQDGYADQYSFNLNYKAKLDTSGKSLNIDFDFVPYRSGKNQYLNSFSFLNDGSAAANPYNIYTPSSQNVNIWSGKIDYDYRLGKIWTLESGLKYSSIVTDSKFSFLNDAATVPVLDETKSNSFRYTENTAAAYTSITGAAGKWSFQGGLRAEYTSTKGHSIIQDSTHVNNYLRLFPTLFISYKSSADNLFGLTYGSRIERPNYWQLNPFKSYSTPYSYQEGDPSLRPAIFHNAELSYTYKQRYKIAAYVNQITDLASNITVQDNVSKIYYDTQKNIGGILDAGVSFSAAFNLTSWWETNSQADIYYRHQKSDYLDGSYNYHNLSLNLSTTQSFTIDKTAGLKAELSARYSTPDRQGILHVASTSDLSAGISKTILNKQGTIRLSAADILYDNSYKIDVNYLNQHNGFYQKADTRNVVLSFSYRLGKNILSRKRSTASEDEKRRTQ